MDWMTYIQSLFGGGGAGGGATPPLSPGVGNMPPIPYIPETGALPASVGPAPQDQGPMMGGAAPGPKLQMPTMDSIRSMFGLPAQTGMSPTGGVPFQPQMKTLGEALQGPPQPPGSPAPGTPIPRPQPPGLGEPTQGNYGGSPETNPNLRPIGATAGKPAAPSQVDVAKLLGGIKQPTGPDVVKPSTPAAPQMRAVGQSELLQLLHALMPGLSRGIRMPTTLGQALEGKPSAWGGIYG